MIITLFVDRKDPTGHSFIKNFWLNLPLDKDWMLVQSRDKSVWMQDGNCLWLKGEKKRSMISSLVYSNSKRNPKEKWLVVIRNRPISLLVAVALKIIFKYRLGLQVSNLHSERLINNKRGTFGKRVLARIEKAIRAYVWKGVDHVFPVSDYMSTYLISQEYIDKYKVYTLPLGIAEMEITGKGNHSRSIDILYAGTCHTSRHPELFFEALAKFLSRHKDSMSVTLLLHGEQYADKVWFKQHYEHQLRSLGVLVIWDIAREDVLKYMDDAKCGVSFYPDVGFEENSPTKVFEYVARGCKPVMFGRTPEQVALAEKNSCLECYSYSKEAVEEWLNRFRHDLANDKELDFLQKQLVDSRGYRGMMTSFRERVVG